MKFYFSFILEHSCSQIYTLPNSDYVNKMWQLSEEYL